jgi:hypothetical protein
MEIQFHALDGGGHLHSPAALPWERKHLYRLKRRLWIYRSCLDTVAEKTYGAILGPFHFITVSAPFLGPIQWVPGIISLRIKRQGCEAEHLPPSSAELKNGWRSTFTLPYFFMAWNFAEHRDNFTLTLLPPVVQVIGSHRPTNLSLHQTMKTYEVMEVKLHAFFNWTLGA